MRFWPFSRPDPQPVAHDESQGEGGYWVPADTTWAQILDYVGNSGDNSPFGIYGVGVGGSRNSALSYATLFRCVTLLSSMAAQAITQGSLRVVDNDGRTSKTPDAVRAIDVFQDFPDGVTPAYQWVEDWASDYLIDGNALAEIRRTRSRRLEAVYRFSSWDANTVPTSDGDFVYRGKYADRLDETLNYVSRRDMAHSRWPRLLRQTSSASVNRFNFAASPVAVMRPALQIGLAGDKFIREWYETGGAHRSQLAISLRERLTSEQRDDLRTYLRQYSTSREPLVMGGGAQFTPLHQNAANRDQAELRAFQVQELARIYGVPAPVVNDNITQWGAGIEQLAKLLWRFGGRQHLDRLLAPLSSLALGPGKRFRIDDTDFLRGDSSAIAELLNATKGDAQSGETATVEERRIWAGLPLEPEHGILRGPAMVDDNPGNTGNET